MNRWACLYLPSLGLRHYGIKLGLYRSLSYILLMRTFSLLLLLLFGWLQYTLWFGKNGIADLQHVNADIEVQNLVNTNLLARNNEMFAEIDDLRQGLDAIEERARHELGMVKEGETFYRMVGDEQR